MSARRRAAEAKRAVPLETLRERALALAEKTPNLPFTEALKKKGLSLICEVKRASPSAGVIAADFSPADIAREYERAGADAVSVLTEPEYFLGKDGYLTDISRAVKLPLLRKDFTVDEYQLYEAKTIGAAAVLLICALSDTATLRRYLEIARELKLSALTEAHDGREIDRALSAGAEIIGVNNRDLHTFRVDLNVSLRLRPLVPANVLFVAESGVRTAEDALALRNAGADAVLVGESVMRARDRAEFIGALRA
jgi:indole-3-glycerol phosphate synthase